MTKPEQTRAALAVVMAVAETIREVGEIPSGTLYTMLMSKVDFAGYQALLSILSNAGLIRVMPSHLIKWVGTKCH